MVGVEVLFHLFLRHLFINLYLKARVLKIDLSCTFICMSVAPHHLAYYMNRMQFSNGQDAAFHPVFL